MLIDGTLIGCGESAKGAGRTGHKKKVRLKGGLSTITEYFTGFQLVWAHVPRLGLPIALGFSKAGIDERKFLLPLLSRAERVIKGISLIPWVAIDRGFMSGPLLYEIAERGYESAIPARHDMDVHKDARREAADPESALRCLRKPRKTRSMHRSANGGPLRKVSLTLKVVGIEGIVFETFAPESEVDSSRHANAHKKCLVAPTINAVVVLTEKNEDTDMVILTNAPVSDPIATFDRYDMRSLIENEGNRTLKQSWHLEKPPQRSAKGAQIHAILVVLSFTLAQAHRIQLEHDQREEDAGRSTTQGEYLRKLARENARKLIVFIDDRFGIYFKTEAGKAKVTAAGSPPGESPGWRLITTEFALLLGRRIKRPNATSMRTGSGRTSRPGSPSTAPCWQRLRRSWWKVIWAVSSTNSTTDCMPEPRTPCASLSETAASAERRWRVGICTAPPSRTCGDSRCWREERMLNAPWAVRSRNPTRCTMS